ncbi:hypothetical protein PF004_g14565 [Phytophthora fragariae]|uniref:Uncharacterized protein n=1 Tax=Phytophthora fragariae TaxID=53985 RepID=A0A6G0NNS9_9STRA|nr:hypothetical protein PF004_g14565 [Phytophthora fragariae]
MGTLSKTAQSAAPVPGTPSSAPKGLEKRKLGTAAKIRERKRRRAAARKENQGAGAKSSVEAATTATAGCEAAGPEALQAAMAEAAAEASEQRPQEAVLYRAARAVALERVLLPLYRGTEVTWVQLLALPTRAQTAATDQRVTARTRVARATELDAATECEDTVIELGTSDTDESSDGDVYYPIYGKYYNSKQVTIKSDYATTKKTWRVARINDRRNSPRGPEYRVLWLRHLLVNRRYYQRTWEPIQQLLDEGFADEVALVHRWKKSGEEKFNDFWPKDEFGKWAIGADARGLCMFSALKRAAEHAGRPDIITQDDIDTFVAGELRERGVDLTRGTSWKVVLRFLRRLRDAGRDFIFKAIDKDNFTIAGRRGARVLEEVPLYNGLYFVVAYNHSLVGHAFVLSAQGKKDKVRRIYDLKEPKPVSSASDWITFVACIRLFIVFKKT